MKLSKLLSQVEHEMLSGTDTDISGLSMDSRKISAGDLFVCIKGLHFDSHDLIEEIEAKGAAAVLVEHAVDAASLSIPVCLVADSRKALSAIAAVFYDYPDKKMELIGITGTNGKTSVTYFIEAMLEEVRHNGGVIGTVGVKLGKEDLNISFTTATTPDTIELYNILKLLRDKNADAVVMEVSSHALALNKVDGLSFKAGVFTNLTQDHLDFHKTMENYFEAKARLFELCECGVINADDPWGKRLIQRLKGSKRLLTFGLEDGCDLRAINVTFTGSGISYELSLKDEKIHINMPIPGKFTVYNTLAAIGTAISMGIPIEVIVRALGKISNVPGRIQNIPNDKDISIIVDYAHSPDALLNIISSVREFTKGHLITVFGCGGDKDKLKRPIMGRIAGSLSDYCILTSDNPRSENPMDIIREIEVGIQETDCVYETIEDRKEAIFIAVNMAQAGDSIIIAGKGHETYQEFRDKTIYFDDSVIVKEALGEM